MAFNEQSSLFQLLDRKTEEELSKIVTKRASKSLKKLIDDISILRDYSSKSLDNFIVIFEKIIGLREYYSGMLKSEEKLQNIDEFYGYFNEFVSNKADSSMDDFLNEISLISEQDELDENVITIMSIHASKGLEFEYLYIIGLEEEFFPLLGEGCNMEEERRLGYVAITRAKSNLTLCYVKSRFYKGQRRFLDRSRFLGEAGLIKGEKLKITKRSEFRKGDLVKHKKFGIGRVQSSTKSGRQYKLNINFGGDKKEILSSFVQSV